MPINFNTTAMSAFKQFQTEASSNPDAIAHSNADGSIKQAGTYKGVMSAVFRTDDEQAQNNQARTALLTALGKAFDLRGCSRSNGKVLFTKDFMDQLEKHLGESFKRGDFGISANGEVTSGKPLTQRRISAILAKAETVGTVCTSKFSPLADKLESIRNKVADTEAEQMGMNHEVHSMTQCRLGHALFAAKWLQTVEVSGNRQLLHADMERTDNQPVWVLKKDTAMITRGIGKEGVLAGLKSLGYTMNLDAFPLEHPQDIGKKLPDGSVLTEELLNQHVENFTNAVLGKIEAYVNNFTQAVEYAEQSGKTDEFYRGLYDLHGDSNSTNVDAVTAFCQNFVNQAQV